MMPVIAAYKAVSEYLNAHSEMTKEEIEEHLENVTSENKQVQRKLEVKTSK